MINWDWTVLGTVNAWQTIATIAVIVVAVWIIVRFLIKFWPGLQLAINFVNALGKLPDFMDRTDKAVARIQHEVEYNNGSSVKDAIGRAEGAIGRVEEGVAGLHRKYDELAEADKRLDKKLDDTRPHPPRPRRPSQKK